MPGAVRVGDLCTGHNTGCFWPPRPCISGSPNVFINGLAVHRVGDSWDEHRCGDNSSHGGTTIEGSSTVFVNGQALARIGDAVSCGSKIAGGSSNVLAND